MFRNVSSVRTWTERLAPWLVPAVILAAVGTYLADRLWIAPQRELERQIEAQRLQIARLEEEKQRLETYLKLLRFTERRARVEVLDQRLDGGGAPITRIRFTEIDATGAPVTASREFMLTGQEVYIDTLTIRFEDHFVEQGDPLKGRALMLFRRIFTSLMRPEEGYVLDRDGQPPEVYAREKAATDFERNLWSRFWELANNEGLARQSGVRAIHGEAPYTRLEANRIYHVTLRSTGEVSITPGAQLAK
ncbi:MAG: hypothetical protein HXY20_02670 [Acidobacteria bacterium]|nr:hypothetical protein [Acidobacteriota bacterium]